MPPSRLDVLYRRMLITKFFEKGWGKPENLQQLFEFRKIVSNRESCYKLVPPDYPVQITKEEKTSDYHLIEGKFISPLELYIPGLAPTECQQAQFQMLLPLKWADESYKPICIQFAGTGDHFFWRRRNFMAKPLLRESGIASILLENPFYGLRKPKDQIRSNLHNVSDIFVMGACLVLENLVLLHWCERMGLGPLGVTGLSMGGHMASLAATNWPKPLVLVPCLSWSTASAVFTQGIMSQSINWDRLETEYFANGNYRERLAKMVTVVDDAFMAGQNFIQHFNESMYGLKEDMKTMDKVAKNFNVAASVSIRNEQQSKFSPGNSLSSADAKIQMSKSVVNDTNIADDLNRHEKLSIPSPVKSATTAASTLEYVGDTIRVAGGALSSALNAGTMQLMSFIMPRSGGRLTNQTIDITKVKWWESEALQFMRGMMDECTHLKNFSVPCDTSLITAICAKDDAYVPRDGCSSLEDIWPGAQVKYLDAGHVSAYVLHQKLFRSCIAENFERAREKYGNRSIKADVEITKISYNELYAKYIEHCQTIPKAFQT